MTKETTKIAAHEKWVETEGKEGERAMLSWADLSDADLSEANLSLASLRKADLSWASLSGANLSLADLSNADLSGASLSGADLSDADLSNADLSNASLRGATCPDGKKWEKMSAEKAIALTIELWTFLADNPGKGKQDWPKMAEMLARHPDAHGPDCFLCPAYSWKCKDCVLRDCNTEDCAYNRWRVGDGKERAEAAREIVERLKG